VRLNFVRQFNSITESVSQEELADFIVLSGPNGSGKSNLLEAVQQGYVSVDGVNSPAVGQTNTAVRLFGLAQLVAAAEGAQTPAAFRDRWLQLQQNTQSAITQMTSPQQHNVPAGSEQLEEMVKADLLNIRQVTTSALARMLAEAGKRLIDFSVEDFRTYSPLLVGIRDPFALTVSELVLTYHQRRIRNDFLQWHVASKPNSPARPLTDQEFLSRYGPPPWELLNETLASVGLDYHLNPPEGTEEELVYEARLVHGETGTNITLAQLSSGEKTLMAVAMSLYTGSRLGEAIELPQLLLLDEADASLHPSMVQSLLRVTDEIFSRRHGVKVILTTHAPTTVALAPPESIYVIRRSGNPRLRHASRDEALSSLTVGLPTLSVRIENKRQVFVESEYDEACYQELFRLLRQRLATQLSLEFIASGKGGQGNAEAVKHLVTSLRNAGNTSVLGVVDRDSRGGAPAGIHYVAGRYSLENLILDPVVLGSFLIRERVIAPEAMSLQPEARHFDLVGADAQSISDFVTSRIQQPEDDGTPVTVSYLGGFSVSMPRFYLDMNGHALEQRLKDAFQGLNGYGAALKLRVTERALKDLPNFTPSDVVNLFGQLLAG
jgi:ABC-type branched-subunit amino acid transport system ATPase component